MKVAQFTINAPIRVDMYIEEEMDDNELEWERSKGRKKEYNTENIHILLEKGRYTMK